MGRKQDDITGRRSGKLVAVEPTAERRNGYTVWRCRCDCGKELLVSSRHLKSGWIRDCGCAKAAPAGARPRPLKDWIGRTFGSLTVVAYDGKRGGKHYWRCRCLCGGSAVVCQSNLKSGHTRSCGCLSDPAGTRHFVEGTCIESIRSRKVSASNSSGIRGVYQNRRTGRWAAQITFQGKTRYLGSFESLEEAAAAREQAEKVFDEFLERHGGPQQPGQGAGGFLPRDAGEAAVVALEGAHRTAAAMAPEGAHQTAAVMAFGEPHREGAAAAYGGAGHGEPDARGFATGTEAGGKVTSSGRQPVAVAGGAYGKED